MPCRGLNFNFYKKNIWAFPGVSHFSNKCSSTVYAKSVLGLLGQLFLKMMLGRTCLNGGTKKCRGMMPWHVWIITSEHSSNQLFYFVYCILNETVSYSGSSNNLFCLFFRRDIKISGSWIFLFFFISSAVLIFWTELQS